MRTIECDKNTIKQNNGIFEKKNTFDGNIKPAIISKFIFESYKNNALSQLSYSK